MSRDFFMVDLPVIFGLVCFTAMAITIIVGVVKIKKSINSSRSSASRSSSDYDDPYRSVTEANIRDLKRERKIIEDKIQESIENGGKLGFFTTEDYQKQLAKNTRDIEEQERYL